MRTGLGARFRAFTPKAPIGVFILMRGELPNLERPEEVPIPNVGPSLLYPVSQAPFRNASVEPVSKRCLRIMSRSAMMAFRSRIQNSTHYKRQA